MSLASSRADSLLGAFDQRGNKVRYASGKPLAKRYISITECGLTEAQKFIKALTTELELGNPEKFAKRQQKRPSDSILGFLIQPMLSATQPLPISVCRATLTAHFA